MCWMQELRSSLSAAVEDFRSHVTFCGDDESAGRAVRAEQVMKNEKAPVIVVTDGQGGRMGSLYITV